MANTIQIKRSAGSAAPGSLGKGELAWVDHGTGGAAGILYVGDMTGAGAAVRKIGGPGWGLELLSNTTLTGTPTAPTVAANDDSTSIATTEYVDRQVQNSTQPISAASDTNISAPAAGHMLLWDGVDTWDNKAISGDITMAADGSAIVTGVAENAVALGTDTSGNYVATVTGTANEIEVLGGAGSEGAAVQIGLPDNVTITGTLTVNGATTTVDSTTVTVADPVFVIGENGADDNKDRGMEFKYNDGAAKVGFFGYDDSAEAFTAMTSATNTGEVFSGTTADAIFADITGTLQTASQPNITGLGTVTSGTWAADIITPTSGGLGVDTSSSTGIASVSGGTWSVSNELAVPLGGTGLTSVAAEGILVGAGTADMTVLTIGSAGQKLAVSAGGSPEWSDSVDGGTF